MYTRQASMKLADSKRHGEGCELFLVEGDSAARSVAMLRDERTQAVLPLQGKPLNAWKATPAKVSGNALYRQLAQALGLRDAVSCDADALASLRFERLLLLFDPDADGIHIQALVLLYLQRFQRPLIDAGRVQVTRAPMFTLCAGDGEPVHAWSPQHAQALTAQLRSAGHAEVAMQGYRGLGSIPPDVLRTCCIDPVTRTARTVGDEDIQAVLRVFAPPA